tara:strand:- start:1086 stop:1196 length:111 start_codon:yes stop_codon:yes gene_type:complete
MYGKKRMKARKKAATKMFKAGKKPVKNPPEEEKRGD